MHLLLVAISGQTAKPCWVCQMGPLVFDSGITPCVQPVMVLHHGPLSVFFRAWRLKIWACFPWVFVGVCLPDSFSASADVHANSLLWPVNVPSRCFVDPHMCFFDLVVFEWGPTWRVAKATKPQPVSSSGDLWASNMKTPQNLVFSDSCLFLLLVQSVVLKL